MLSLEGANLPRIAIAAALLLGIAPVSARIRAMWRTANLYADRLSGHRLAFLQRQGLRVFDACDTGHFRNPEAGLRALEISQ